MSTADNPKKRPHEDMEQPIIFKILEGALKASDYATTTLLVPDDTVEDLLNALRGAEASLFVWTVGDEEITDIQNIPNKFAHPIRSIGEIPKGKAESELLDWLIHGDSFFSKKYVILKVKSGSRSDCSYCEEYALEVRKKDHLDRVAGAWNTIWDLFLYYDDDENDHLDDVSVIDRGQYLRKFDGCVVVDEDLVGKFEKMAESKDLDVVFNCIHSLNERCK